MFNFTILFSYYHLLKVSAFVLHTYSVIGYAHPEDSNLQTHLLRNAKARHKCQSAVSEGFPSCRTTTQPHSPLKKWRNI